MKFKTKEIITILRHCGNQGDACPCSDCLLKDNPKGNECLEMYNIAADKIENLNQENEDLKRLLKSALDGFEYVDKYFGCAGCKENWEKCPFNGGEKDVCTDIWKHKEEIEEALKDEEYGVFKNYGKR